MRGTHITAMIAETSAPLFGYAAFAPLTLSKPTTVTDQLTFTGGDHRDAVLARGQDGLDRAHMGDKALATQALLPSGR